MGHVGSKCLRAITAVCPDILPQQQIKLPHGFVAAQPRGGLSENLPLRRGALDEHALSLRSTRASVGRTARRAVRTCERFSDGSKTLASKTSLATSVNHNPTCGLTSAIHALFCAIMCARPKRAPFAISTTARVLGYLRESKDYVSGQRISEELGLSRVAIWKHIKTLQAQGCRIDACRHCGYRLMGAPDMPTEEAVAAQLRTEALGRPLLFFREVDSTNHQLSMRAMNAPEGLALVADHQTAGRGRMGRAWFSPAGANVYLSILLRPQVNLAQIATLPLVVGCAVARAVGKLAADIPVRIKWPNDLHVNGRKLGGILCEMVAEMDRVQHVVVGIGLNTNLRRSHLPAAIARNATSLAIETRHTFSRAEVVAELLNQFEPAYQLWCAEGLKPFLPEIAALDLLKGNAMRIDQAGNRVVEGIAAGIHEDGTLLLRQADGSNISVCSGDSHVLKDCH